MEKDLFIKKIISLLDNYILKDQEVEIELKLLKLLENIEVKEISNNHPKTNSNAISLFISSKRIEGCSERTLNYYKLVLDNFFSTEYENYYNIETEDIREYLSNYKQNNNVTQITVDNVRRVISSFFSWLEEENYIEKNPTKRIHKVKVGKIVKQIYSDEEISMIRKSATCIRNLSIIDLLFSTGMRIGELVKLNRDQIDLITRECVVIGKGNKQRKVYFDAKTKLEIEKYLKSRNDTNDALFVSVFFPYNRLAISGVEIFLKKIGQELNIKVHPHKFRRTIATKAIDKGMPIEQVQKMLGHSKIDTTLEYALVDDNNVKISHHKYLE